MKKDRNIYKWIAQAVASYQIHQARIIARCYGYKLAAFYLRRCGWGIADTLRILLQREVRS